MKLSITGANGFVGSYLTHEFRSNGVEVYCIPTSYLNNLREDATLCDTQITEQLRNSDCVIHLAARNNNKSGTSLEFLEDNFYLTKSLIEHCEILGIKRFIFSSSTKCLDTKSSDPYTESKKTAESHIFDLSTNGNLGLKMTVLRLPPVYGEGCKGTLRYLMRLPRFLKSIATPLLRSLTPICSLDSLKIAIDEILEGKTRQYEVIASDKLSRLSPYWLYYWLTTFLFVIATIILSPLLLIVATLIKLTSEGPAIFVQERVGRNKATFKCVKFRTMSVNAPNVGTHEIGSASVTKIGSVLRKTKIDELPQVINILKGEMTLIGPRPCLPSQSEVISKRNDHKVFDALPGITGQAQISKVDMSKPILISVYDQRYLRSRSILNDIKISIATVFGKGNGDPAAESKQ